jgi:hypothetical protein
MQMAVLVPRAVVPVMVAVMTVMPMMVAVMMAVMPMVMIAVPVMAVVVAVGKSQRRTCSREDQAPTRDTRRRPLAGAAWP